MNWQAIVDFDGTITLQDTTDQLLERFADPRWHEIEEEWLAGCIGSRECMARQIELLRMTPDELDRFAAAVAIDWSFKSFVRLCERREIRLTIASDGLDHVIRAVLARAGLSHLPVVANRLTWRGGNRWQLESPHARADCRSASGTCKCAASRGHHGLTLVVGDGRSDQCVAEEADFVFAKGKLAAHCRARNLPHRPIADFAQATAFMEDLLTQAPEPAAIPVLKEEFHE